MDEAGTRRLLELIEKSPANYEYVFHRLDDAGWLKTLVDAGFFKHPPPPERDDEWVRFPSWPESQYLRRIAAAAPSEVFEVVRQIPETENVRVHEDIVGIAEALPARECADIARSEAAWLEGYQGHLMSFPDAAAALIARLAHISEFSAALDLSESLLAVRPGLEDAGFPTAVARMDDYNYGEVLASAWPPIMAGDPSRGFAFLCDRLGDVIDALRREGFDGTYISRAAVEDHAQNSRGGLLDVLVDAVRDAAVSLARTPEGMALARAELRSREAPLFRRIELHTLRVAGVAREVAAVLVDENLARDVQCWHEYSELLRVRFRDLAPTSQQRVLRMLVPDDGESHDADDDSAARHRRWQFLRMSLIADDLDVPAHARYVDLLREFEAPEHPAFLSYHSSWVGPTSPIGRDELRSLAPAAALETYQAANMAGGPTDASPEGFGRILREIVGESPEAYADDALVFSGQDPTVVRSVIEGLADAAKAGRGFPWNHALPLCAWTIAQPRSADDNDHGLDRDPHWGWARKAVASLLSNGFSDGAAEIPGSLRSEVWELLVLLTEDPDPTPDHELRFGGDNMDPATLAINTTRGEAMHGVARYWLWVERLLEADGESVSRQSVPEVYELLERRLDVNVEPSLAIRSVYGQWFTQFVRLDRSWAESVAPRVFPDDADAAAFFRAAWQAYIVFNQPYTDVFTVLATSYAVAVSRLGESEGHSPFAGDPAERLGDHLFTLRVTGAGDAVAGALFEEFWSSAPDDQRGQFLANVGWSLQHTDSLAPAVEARFRATFDWVASATSEESARVLAGFGAWLGSPALDGTWLLRTAQMILGRGVHLKPDFVVFRAVSRLAGEHPREAVDVLRGAVISDAPGWSFAGSTDEIRSALVTAIASGGDAKRAAEDVAHLLGARGFEDFRDLVDPQAS